MDQISVQFKSKLTYEFAKRYKLKVQSKKAFLILTM